ncbi:MAG TPA: STAS domain-containing protein [Micromonosporaceae bacterium]
MPLLITRDDSGPQAVLVVDGDLDLAGAPDLIGEALALIDAGVRDVVIDAGAIGFCDSSGLSAFVRIANRLRDDGGHLAIAAPSANLRRILEVTGLIEAFIVVDAVPDAIARLNAVG